MDKPAISPGALRVGVQIFAVVVAAVATVLNGVNFEELVSGGFDAWKKLGITVALAAGAALFGWTKKWLSDFSVEDLPLEWRQSFPLVPAVPAVADQPTTSAVGMDDVNQ